MSQSVNENVDVAATRALLKILREELMGRKHLAPHWGDYGPILQVLIDVALHCVLENKCEPEGIEASRSLGQCGPHKCADCGYDDLGVFPLGVDGVRRCKACHEKYESSQKWFCEVEEPSPKSDFVANAERFIEYADRVHEAKQPEPAIAVNEAISKELGTAGIWEGCDVEVSPEDVARCMAEECEPNEPSPVCPTCGVNDPKLHPALGFEGEVQLCEDPWHRPTAEEIRATWLKQEPSPVEPECESCNGVQCDAARAGAYCPAANEPSPVCPTLIDLLRRPEASFAATVARFTEELRPAEKRILDQFRHSLRRPKPEPSPNFEAASDEGYSAEDLAKMRENRVMATASMCQSKEPSPSCATCANEVSVDCEPCASCSTDRQGPFPKWVSREEPSPDELECVDCGVTLRKCDGEMLVRSQRDNRLLCLQCRNDENE